MKDVETIYRQGLRTALSIRNCINNEIVYIESGAWPIEIRIVKQQLKFWLSLQKFLEDHEGHYIIKLLVIAENYSYITHYKNLSRIYDSQQSCENTLKNNFKVKFTEKIRSVAAIDEDSRLGAYLRINPSFEKPTLSINLNVIELILVGIVVVLTIS